MSRYFDEKGNLKSDLLSDEAEREAKKFVVFRHDNKVDTFQSITSAQLRKFYNEFKGLEKRLDFAATAQAEDEAAFGGVLPLVKMVKSKVAYASGSKKVPQAFAKWLEQHVDAINSAKEFRAFLLHFEAVVGFCYGLGLRNN
jgi:CRISPR-associated protein Csm2